MGYKPHAMRAPLLLALGLGNAEYLRARSHGRTLQEVNLVPVPEAEAADLKKQEEAQREKAMAEAAAAMEKAKAMLAEAEKAKAAVLGALPDHSQFSVPNLVCAGVKPTHGRVCRRAARTFGHPVVYRTLKTNVIDALGGIVVPFAYLNSETTAARLGMVASASRIVGSRRTSQLQKKRSTRGSSTLQITDKHRSSRTPLMWSRRTGRIMVIFA